MFDRRTLLRFSPYKPVPILALTVTLAMAAAEASSAPPARAAAIDPAFDLLQSGAYAIGPALGSAERGTQAIALRGEVVRAQIDGSLAGLAVRRRASTRTGRLRLTDLESGVSVVAAIVVDFSIEAPIAVSPEVALALGLDTSSSSQKVLIERE